jgi:uncharacterized protein Usg
MSMSHVDPAFAARMAGHGLLTAEISYWMPDHPALLQQFVWQQEDLAPLFPGLQRFLDHWRREVDATLHQIRIAHTAMVAPPRWQHVDEVLRLH